MIEFLKELRRRKVWLFGGIYLALGWVLLQVAIAVETTLSLPGWVDQVTLILLVLGFPVALLLAWAQESEAPATEDFDPGAVELSEERPGFLVAVLPFNDLSHDGAFQEIADGVPEDIITRLSLIDPLRVSARNSSFAFRGGSLDIRDVGKQLNVRFVLEGSIRAVGESTRITAQLIDALTGEHAWSDSFDCPVVALDKELDEVVEEIVAEAANAIASLEVKRLTARDPAELSVTDLTSLAFFHLADINLPNLGAAEELVQKALEKAPDNEFAHALMARVQASLPLWGSGNETEHWSLATEHLDKVKLAGTPDMPTFFSMAMADYAMGRLSNLRSYAEQMRELGPKHPGAWATTALSFLCAGMLKEYFEAADRAVQLWSVRSPFYLMFLSSDATAHLGLRNFAEAEAHSRKYLSIRDNVDVREILVIALAHQNKVVEAGKELEALKAVWPGGLTLETAERRFRLFCDCNEMIELQLEGLGLAGLE